MKLEQDTTPEAPLASATGRGNTGPSELNLSAREANETPTFPSIEGDGHELMKITVSESMVPPTSGIGAMKVENDMMHEVPSVRANSRNPEVKREMKDETEDEDKMEDEDEVDDDKSSEVSLGDDLRDDLKEALEGDFDFKWNYYYTNTTLAAPNPCPDIDGLGLIGLPLSPRGAKSIIEYSAPKSVGRGSGNTVEAKISSIREIEAKQVKFDNLAWNEWVRNYVVKVVWSALGVAPPVAEAKCEFHKLLLYELGSHFLPPQDVEKVEGSFATVLVILPSLYTGGEIHLSHSSSTNFIDLAPNSFLNTSILAWYNDVRYKTKPITSGYGLALSYNLIHTAPGVPRLAVPSMSVAAVKLRHVLRKWHKSTYQNKNVDEDMDEDMEEDEEDADHNVMVYLLKRKYSDEDLEAGAKALKGDDARLLANIKPVADDVGYRICLANLEYHVSGTGEGFFEDQPHYKRARFGAYSFDFDFDSDSDSDDEEQPTMDEINERSYILEDFVDLEGASLIGTSNFPLSKANVIPKEPFDSVEPDEREHDFTTRYDYDVEDYYRRTVLVLFHEENEMDLLGTVGGIPYYLHRLRKSTTDTPTVEDQTLANLVLQVLRPTDKETSLTMIDYAIRWNNLDMWRAMLKKSIQPITAYGVDELVRAWKKFNFTDVCPSYEQILQQTTRLSDWLNFIQCLLPHATPEEYEPVQSWVEEQTVRALETLIPTNEDISTLIAVGHVKGTAFLAKGMLPGLRKNPLVYTFVIAFVKSLYENKARIPARDNPQPACQANKQMVSTNALDDFIEKLLSIAVARWDTVIAQPKPKQDHGFYSLSYTEPHSTVPPAKEQKIQRIVDLVKLCHATGHMKPCSELFLLVLKIQGDTREKFESLYTTLVPRLREVMCTKRMNLFAPPFSDFLQFLVGLYLRDILGVKKQTQVAVRMLGCGQCGDCTNLNSFMASNETTKTFRLKQCYRTHLEKYLKAAPDLVSFDTIRSGSPYGLQVTKQLEATTAYRWESRLAHAKAFLWSIGDETTIIRLMGSHYGDVVKALAGTQPFALTVGDAANNSMSGHSPGPAAQTITTTPMQASGSVVGLKRSSSLISSGSFVALSAPSVPQAVSPSTVIPRQRPA